MGLEVLSLNEAYERNHELGGYDLLEASVKLAKWLNGDLLIQDKRGRLKTLYAGVKSIEDYLPNLDDGWGQD